MLVFKHFNVNGTCNKGELLKGNVLEKELTTTYLDIAMIKFVDDSC